VSGPRPSVRLAEEARAPSAQRVPFWDAFRFWLLLGCINFGGPAGQIATMHHELVGRRRWISDARFLHALNYCMLLPGPEAQQLATYVGWLLHRTVGGLIAGVFFVLPGFFVLLVLSWIYVVHGNVPWVAAIFYGLRAAVIAIVAAAVIRIGSRALRHPTLTVIAAAAFAAIFLFRVAFPLIVIGAGIVGFLGARFWPGVFVAAPGGPQATRGNRPDESSSEGLAIADDRPPEEHTRPSLRRSATVLAACLAAWWVPLGAVIAWRGLGDVLSQQAIFFSKAAMVTFGGAYAVLTYLAQAAVERYGWLATGEMLDGLGLAESTPGPLILVTQFVGFIAAFRNPGDLPPAVAGVLGAAVTVWATFVPSFLWIFLGAPFIERLRGNQFLSGALSAITAAVVGVILNLAVWFALHNLFRVVAETTMFGMTLTFPRPQTIDPYAAAIATVAFVGMWRHGWGILHVVLGSAISGLAVHMLAN
jgi:chromate transporter